MDLLSDNQLARSVLDALTSSICVIDADGIIRAENGAWQQFSLSNGGKSSYIGASYFHACLKSSDNHADPASEFAAAIWDVLNGKRERFETEYPCHSPTQKRWFLGRVTALRAASDAMPTKQTRGAVISHQDITDRKQLELRLKRFAETDDLTGLQNRRSLFERLNIKSTGHKTGHIRALLLLDLDNFKEINDTSGHDVGDIIITQVANRLTKLSSEWSSPIVARMGGDEFALLLEVKQPWSVVPIAEKLLALLSDPYLVEGQPMRSGGSIGIAFYPADAITPQALFKAADLALYKAKNSGRNRYVFYTKSLSETAEERQALFNRVRSGIAGYEFEPYFQPIVRLKDKSLLGFEALIRWKHPDKGLLTPAHFLAALRDKHMGEVLSQSVLNQVIEHLSSWPATTVSVNLTSGQLNNANFVDYLCRQTSTHAVRPEQLKLEITEDVVLDDNDRSLTSLLSRLRDAGFKISLDDFGTGYASLSHLSRFPLDEIKIDMAFVKQLNTSRDARAVVRSVTHLAHELGLSVVAEGIETAEIEGIVAALGCDKGQGYLFGKPQPASAVPDLIQQWRYSSRASSAAPGPNLRRSSR